MRRVCAIIGLLCLLGQGAWAADYRGVGNWADPNGWSDGAPPSGAVEVKIRGEETILTLNTSTDPWGAAQRLRVYEGAKLIVAEGAELLGAGWARIGAGSLGSAEQTGGLVRINNERLAIGDSAGSDGYYTIRGGTVTYSGDRGDLLVGARGGKGTFTVVGTGPIIQMGKLIVADVAGASGTVEFQLTAEGVSPIVLAGSASIDALGNEALCALVVGSAGGAPQADVVLVDLPAGAAAATAFDTVNGEPAAEGAAVTVRDRLTVYKYTLTYVGGATGNDIVLRYDSFVPPPTVVYVTDRIGADSLVGDQGWIDWLVAEGYNVDARRGYWIEPLDPNRIAELEAADLIIVSGLLDIYGFLDTTNYVADGEVAKWNSLATPLINLNAYLAAGWHWVNSGTFGTFSRPGRLLARDPNHPIFAGIALDPNGLVEILDPNAVLPTTSFIKSPEAGNGKLLASLGDSFPWIAEWAPGLEFYSGAGQFGGGWRMMFMAGNSDLLAAAGEGEFNLNEAGRQILRNVMVYLIARGQEQANAEEGDAQPPATPPQQ